MKKRLVSALLAVVMIILSFSSCEGTRQGVLWSKRSELYSVACFSVPFIKDDPNWDIVEEVERDSYGRIMFKCSSNSKMLYDYCGENLQAMVICQKYDEQYSYYYDNYSFIYLSDEQNNDIEHLKSINDWNQELDVSKMLKVENTLYPFSEYNAYKEESVVADISEYLPDFDKNDNIKYDLDLLSLDNYKRGLFVIREYSTSGEKYTFYNAYFAVCDENYEVLIKNGEPCILKIDDMVNCQDDMKAVKELCGWNEPR